MKTLAFAYIIFSSLAFGSNEYKVDLVKVDKSERKLFLYSGGEIIKTFSVSLGENDGPKRQANDKKTPEGKYKLTEKKPNSQFHKAILISYPNEDDKAEAKKRGVDPGGLIEIHGQSNDWWSRFNILWQWTNWTDGCIALTDKDMDTVWRLVDVPIPIEIVP